MAKRKAAAVSMEEELFESAKARAERLGLSTFSAYVVQLIRQDLMQRGQLNIRETPVEYEAKPPKKKPTNS
jgi:hypothetical protein